MLFDAATAQFIVKALAQLPATRATQLIAQQNARAEREAAEVDAALAKAAAADDD